MLPNVCVSCVVRLDTIRDSRNVAIYTHARELRDDRETRARERERAIKPRVSRDTSPEPLPARSAEAWSSERGVRARRPLAGPARFFTSLVGPPAFLSKLRSKYKDKVSLIIRRHFIHGALATRAHLSTLCASAAPQRRRSVGSSAPATTARRCARPRAFLYTLYHHTDTIARARQPASKLLLLCGQLCGRERRGRGRLHPGRHLA